MRPFSIKLLNTFSTSDFAVSKVTLYFSRMHCVISSIDNLPSYICQIIAAVSFRECTCPFSVSTTINSFSSFFVMRRFFLTNDSRRVFAIYYYKRNGRVPSVKKQLGLRRLFLYFSFCLMSIFFYFSASIPGVRILDGLFPACGFCYV